MSKETKGKQGNLNEPNKKRVFKNFAEYWHYVKPLSEEQRKTIADSLTKAEQRSLQVSYKKGGWEDLFMRNQCDKTLDAIVEKFDIDLLLMRTQILSGRQKLMQKSFWEYVKTCFDGVPWQHISYIFDGIVEVESEEPGYVLLKIFDSAEFIDDEEDNSEFEQE